MHWADFNVTPQVQISLKVGDTTTFSGYKRYFTRCPAPNLKIPAVGGSPPHHLWPPYSTSVGPFLSSVQRACMWYITKAGSSFTSEMSTCSYGYVHRFFVGSSSQLPSSCSKLGDSLCSCVLGTPRQAAINMGWGAILHSPSED